LDQAVTENEKLHDDNLAETQQVKKYKKQVDQYREEKGALKQEIGALKQAAEMRTRQVHVCTHTAYT